MIIHAGPGAVTGVPRPGTQDAIAENAPAEAPPGPEPPAGPRAEPSASTSTSRRGGAG